MNWPSSHQMNTKCKTFLQNGIVRTITAWSSLCCSPRNNSLAMYKLNIASNGLLRVILVKRRKRRNPYIYYSRATLTLAKLIMIIN